MQGEWDAATYPIDLVRRMGELELFTDGIEHPDLPRTSPLAAGLVNMEISRHDGSLATALAVQGGLALRTLAFTDRPSSSSAGSPPSPPGTVLGAFALTEPDTARIPCRSRPQPPAPPTAGR